MAIKVSAYREVALPAKVIAGYMFDPVNDPVWIGGISEATLLTGVPVRKGAQVIRKAKFLGKTVEYILEVEEFIANHLMVMESVKGPFPMKVIYRLDKLDDQRTKVSIEIGGTSKGFYKIGDWLMQPMIRKNISADLKRLQSVLEK